MAEVKKVIAENLDFLFERFLLQSGDDIVLHIYCQDIKIIFLSIYAFVMWFCELISLGVNTAMYASLNSYT